MTFKDYNKLKKVFDNYCHQFDLNSSNILLKYNHSFAVASYMEDLAKRLKLSKSDIYLAKAIGLLHDIGRFEQLKRFNSFSDQLFDHGKFAVVYLFDEGHIRDFIDDDTDDNVINKAILNHNLLEIEDGLSERELFFSKMIRDMDKVDIFYQIANKGICNFTNKPTKKVLDDYNNKKGILKTDVKVDSDKVIQMLAFIYDINFDESFEILRESENFNFFICSIRVDDKYKELFNKIISKCLEITRMGDIYEK